MCIQWHCPRILSWQCYNVLWASLRRSEQTGAQLAVATLGPEVGALQRQAPPQAPLPQALHLAAIFCSLDLGQVDLQGRLWAG